MESNKKILLGTIGYHLLGNHSIGPILLDKIKEQSWAQEVDVQEMNWGPIAIVQQFQTNKHKYDRVVFFTAIERDGREIGEYTIYKWGGRQPSNTDVQACVGDAVTGVISAENLLIIGEHFGIWPKEVYLFDVQPGPEQAGETLTPEVGVHVTDYLLRMGKLCHEGIHPSDKIDILYGDEIMAANAAAKIKLAQKDN